jgi:glyoxylase-like metal-dependent hydrolase (beta-lactamase superfamily II)
MPCTSSTSAQTGAVADHSRTRIRVPSRTVIVDVVDVGTSLIVWTRRSTLRAMSVWAEVGDRVFTRRYAFYDQNIGAILGDDGVLIVDTRISHRQADEILVDLAELTPLPVRAVVNTHGHNDHAFGNHRFRPAPIWGHSRCARMIHETGARQLAAVSAAIPDLAAELAEVVLDPPDCTFEGDEATLDFDAGGRAVDLRYLGRGHTDNDIVVVVPDADVIFAGDLVENGAPPFFGDGYPMEWPATVERLVDLVTGAVVPGHGDVSDRGFAVRSMVEIRTIAELATLVHEGTLGMDDAVLRTPYPADTAREPLERAVAQLRGELD